MQRISPEKILPVAFYVTLIAALGIIGYAGLARRGALPAEAGTSSEQAAPSATPLPLRLCEQSTAPMCILSTGYDAKGNLLISLKTGPQPLPPVYGLLQTQGLEIRFDCQAVQSSPRLLYCLGPFEGDVQTVTFALYRAEDESLLAAGPLAAGEAVAMVPPPVASVPPTRTPVSFPVRPLPGSPTPPAYPSYPSYRSYP